MKKKCTISEKYTLLRNLLGVFMPPKDRPKTKHNSHKPNLGSWTLIIGFEPIFRCSKPVYYPYTTSAITLFILYMYYTITLYALQGNLKSFYFTLLLHTGPKPVLRLSKSVSFLPHLEHLPLWYTWTISGRLSQCLSNQSIAFIALSL